MPGTFLDIMREVVSMATQPPRSMESASPGCSGSYERRRRVASGWCPAGCAR